MGAVLSQLGEALRTIFLATLGKPVLEYEKILDQSVDSVTSTFNSLQSVIDDFGANNIPGAGNAIGNLSRAISNTKGTVDNFINVSVSIAFRAFVWILVAGTGVLAITEAGGF